MNFRTYILICQAHFGGEIASTGTERRFSENQIREQAANYYIETVSENINKPG
jgi:hypothetical protein